MKRILFLTLLVATAALRSGASAAEAAPPLDLLVVAPHPDDEVIGCAGIMLQALERKQRVGVVVITSGDGYPALAAVVARKDRDQLVPDDFKKNPS